MRLLVAAVAAIAALAAVDQLFLWMERRGRLYWRRRKRDPRDALLGPIDNVFNPAHEHVVEQQENEERLADFQADIRASIRASIQANTVPR